MWVGKIISINNIFTSYYFDTLHVVFCSFVPHGSHFLLLNITYLFLFFVTCHVHKSSPRIPLSSLSLSLSLICSLAVVAPQARESCRSGREVKRSPARSGTGCGMGSDFSFFTPQLIGFWSLWCVAFANVSMAGSIQISVTNWSN